jgi:hypothetical protein
MSIYVENVHACVEERIEREGACVEPSNVRMLTLERACVEASDACMLKPLTCAWVELTNACCVEPSNERHEGEQVSKACGYQGQG